MLGFCLFVNFEQSYTKPPDYTLLFWLRSANLQKYNEAVGKPLDLSIIRDKIESCEYGEAADCLNDLRAMFDGCRQSFKPDSVRQKIFLPDV